MPTGIDVGTRTIRVATPEGTTRYSNEIRRVNGGTETDETGGSDGWVTVETDGGNYVVVSAGAVTDAGSGGDWTAEDSDGDSLGRVFGGASEAPPGVRGDLVEAFLTAILDDGNGGNESDEGGDDTADTLCYVADSAGADPLAAVAAETGPDVVPLDPGMAVCYDVLGAPATGVGVAVTSDRAVATLAAGGVPVATASVPVDGDWYDLGVATSGIEGLTSDWRARQTEALFADLGAALGRTAPVVGGAVPVAIGGEAAPAGDTDRLAAALGAELPLDVGTATVADDPDASLARGALVAADADDGVEPPLPAFAVDVPFVGTLADFRAATDALGAGAALSATTGDDAGPAGDDGAPAAGGDGRSAGVGGAVAPAAGNGVRAVDAAGAVDAVDGEGDEPDLRGVVARTRADLEALDRRGAMTARGVSDLVDRLDDAGAGDAGEAAGGAAVEALRADVETLEAQLSDSALASLEGDLATELDDLRAAVDALEADLDRLDEETATAAAVAELEASVESLDEAVTAVEDDTEKIRAALTGLDDESETEAPELSGEAADGLRADALREEIDALRAALDDRTGDVWSELDDLDDRLVDVEATAGDVPDLESTAESTRNAVADLEDETATLREAIDELRSSLAEVTADTPSTGDVQAVEADLERLRDDLDDLRAAFEGTERVDPATVEEIQTDLDGLRGTLISRADRLESMEGTTENLRERIETVYQNSAKAEALSSVETEVARVRKTAAGAMERTNEMTETVSDLDETVADHDEQLGMLSTNVDNLAGSAVTRPEMESDIRRIEERLEDLESDLRTEMEGVRSMADQKADVEPVEEGGNELVVTLQTATFVFLGALGAALAFLSGFPLLAGAFVVFAIMPAILSWLVN
jgi:pilus assembly protein FimV